LLDLAPTEYGLLATLLDHPGNVFSRSSLLNVVLPKGLNVSDRSIDSHIKNVRRKLVHAMPDPDPIQSVYGVGYRFEG